MERQKVIIIASKWLAGGVLDEFLTELNVYDIHRVTSQHESALLKAIQRHEPDILIMDAAIRPHCLQMMLAQLATHPHLRLVIVDLKENHLEVYDHSQITVTKSADFLAAL